MTPRLHRPTKTKQEPLILLEMLIKQHYEVGGQLEQLLKDLKGRFNEPQQRRH